MTRTTWVAAALGASLSMTGCLRDDGLRLDGAAVVPEVGDAPAALYFTLRNGRRAPDAVVALDVDGAGRVSIQTLREHRIPLEDAEIPLQGLMEPVASVRVEAYGELSFVPGGFVGVLEELAAPVAPGDSLRVVVRMARGDSVWARVPVVPYRDLARVLDEGRTLREDRSPEPSVAHGRVLYRTHGCASCHGPEGQGDGRLASTLDPPPRDFRDASSFRTGTDVEGISKTIAAGIPAGGAMPPYPHLSEVERRSLALHILSLLDPSMGRENQP